MSSTKPNITRSIEPSWTLLDTQITKWGFQVCKVTIDGGLTEKLPDYTTSQWPTTYARGLPLDLDRQMLQPVTPYPFYQLAQHLPIFRREQSSPVEDREDLTGSKIANDVFPILWRQYFVLEVCKAPMPMEQFERGHKQRLWYGEEYHNIYFYRAHSRGDWVGGEWKERWNNGYIWS